jgi:trigger factor
MSNTNEAVNNDVFELALSGPLSIEMPPVFEVSEEDIDAQLFTHVANAPKKSGISGIKDLDDAWVAENYPGITTVKELRHIIKKRIIQENNYVYQNTKYARCADALVAALKGEISEEAVAAGLDDTRRRSEMTIHSYGESIPQYLNRTGMSEEEFEAKLIEETKHDIALNIALDILVKQDDKEMTDEDLPKYLSIEDLDAFLTEVRQSGKLADAKQAAARVKVMRDLIETAKITQG